MKHYLLRFTTAIMLTGITASAVEPTLSVTIEPASVTAGDLVKITMEVSTSGQNKTLKTRLIKPEKKAPSPIIESGASEGYGNREISIQVPTSEAQFTIWVRGFGGGFELLGDKDSKQTLRKWVNLNASGKWGWAKIGNFKPGEYEKLTVIVPQTHKDGKLIGALDYVVLSSDQHATPENCADFHPGAKTEMRAEQLLKYTFKFGGESHTPYLWSKGIKTGADSNLMPNATAIDGYCSRSLEVRLPSPELRSRLWLRGYGGGGELHGFKNGKTILRKWVNFNSPGKWSWINLGDFSGIEYERLQFIVPQCVDPAGKFIGGIDCMILSGTPDFNPETEKLSGPSNVFYWQTSQASIGRQPFRLEATTEKVTISKEIVIEVIPAKTSPATTKTDKGNLSFISFENIANLGLTPFSEKLKVLGNAASDEASLPEAISAAKRDQKKFIGVWKKIAEDELKKREVTVAQADHNVVEPAHLPESVTIPVGANFGGLRFFHTIKGAGELDELLFKYVVEYEDGSRLDIPVKEGGRIAGQLKPVEITNGRRIYASMVENRSVNIYRTDWSNPKPDNKIARITIQAEKQKVIPVLLGIAGITTASALNEPEPVATGSAVSVNFRKQIMPVRAGLFAINNPYLYQKNNEAYFSLFREIGFPETRIWNRFHPPGGGAPIPLEKLQECDEQVKKLLSGSSVKLMLNLFADLPEWVMKDKKPEQHLDVVVKWYIDVLTWCVREKHWPITTVELYNEHLIGHPDAENQVRYSYFNALAAAIKQKFPEIQIGGTAECWPDQKMIEQFVVQCGNNLDVLTWHLYATGKNTTPLSALLDRTNYLTVASIKLDSMMKKHFPNKKINQAITEFNLNYAAWKPIDNRQTTGEGTVWLFSVLRHLLYDGKVETAMFWHYWSGGTYGVIDGNGKIRPNGTFYFLLNKYLKGAMLYNAGSNDPQVEVLAAESKNFFVIALINKAEIPRNVELEILNAPTITCGSFETPVISYRIGEGDETFNIVKNKSFAPGKNTIRLEKRSMIFNVIPKSEEKRM